MEKKLKLAIVLASYCSGDLLSPTGNLENLTVQANKLTLFSNWAGLVISSSKTKVTGSLKTSPSKDQNGLTPSEALEPQLKNNILVQNQAIKYITPSSRPLPLSRSHTDDGSKLEAPAQAHGRNLSLAHAFAVTPCSYLPRPG
jgi:hypothetical protein